MKNNKYICCVPYHSNSKAYDHGFCYACVKWWYLQAIFSFFKKFRSLGCNGCKSAKNGPKWQKLCHASYLRNHASCYCHWWHTFVKWWYISRRFFFQKFVLLGCYGSRRAKKRSKMRPNSVFCTPYLRNYTLYDFHLRYTCVK